MRDSINTLARPKHQAPLRAMVEIVGGELMVYPIADCDLDERRIMDALRLFQEAPGER